MDPLDGAGELKRCLVAVVELDRRSEHDADVRHSFAENAIGQVTGAVPLATGSPFTVIVTLSGPRGMKSGWFVSIPIFTLPAGSCACARILVRWISNKLYS